MGGCPFLYALHIAKGLPSCLPSSSLVVNFQTIVANFQQNGAKVRFYLPALVFSREFRRPKTAKFKIYLSFEDCRGFRCGSLFGAVVVSTGCRWSGSSRLQDLPDVGGGPPVVCSVPLSLLFVPLLPLLSCNTCEICLVSRFKGVFSVVLGRGCIFIWVDVFAWLVWLLCA